MRESEGQAPADSQRLTRKC